MIANTKSRSFFITQFYRYKTLFVHYVYMNEQKFCAELGINTNLDRARRALNHGCPADEILTNADVLIMKVIGGVDKTLEVDDTYFHVNEYT